MGSNHNASGRVAPFLWGCGGAGCFVLGLEALLFKAAVFCLLLQATARLVLFLLKVTTCSLTWSAVTLSAKTYRIYLKYYDRICVAGNKKCYTVQRCISEH